MSISGWEPYWRCPHWTRDGNRGYGYAGSRPSGDRRAGSTRQRSEVDLERDEVRDSRGRRIDADYVERAVSDVHARAEGRSVSEVAREALERYLG